MNGLWSFEALIIFFLIMFIIVLIWLAIFLSRKIKEGELPEGDMNLLIPHIDHLMRIRGWETKVNPYAGKITVIKDSVIATDIHLRQQPNGRIDIRHASNAGTLGWVLLIVLLFIFIIAGLIFAVILHVYSRKFAREDVIPMIMLYPYGPIPPPYPSHIPQGIYLCTNCGQPLRFREEAQKWYCDKCGNYV